MTYKVEINPSKEKEFLQLLQAWQSLDVVWSFGILAEKNEQTVEDTYIPSWERKKAATRDYTEEYRDLVDWIFVISER